jgi:hypothetical protein
MKILKFIVIRGEIGEKPNQDKPNQEKNLTRINLTRADSLTPPYT